jgi:hypothetical protein
LLPGCEGGAAAHLGVSASVHSGNLVCGGNSQRVHSKQGVMPGRITLRMTEGEDGDGR